MSRFGMHPVHAHTYVTTSHVNAPTGRVPSRPKVASSATHGQDAPALPPHLPSAHMKPAKELTSVLKAPCLIRCSKLPLLGGSEGLEYEGTRPYHGRQAVRCSDSRIRWRIRLPHPGSACDQSRLRRLVIDKHYGVGIEKKVLP